MKTYTNYKDFKADDVTFQLGADRSGKATIGMFYGEMMQDVGLVTPPCITNWPRVTGDGNYGTMWGPTDPQKSKFTLDLTDAPLDGQQNNAFFGDLAKLVECIDDRLLDFVQNNQLKILGRKNLSREEVKMLQIRSIRPKYDKCTGALTSHAMQMSTSKYAWDGMGGKFARNITICDKDGQVIPNGDVKPGDVVAATIFANMIYTGVGGDKFGIHWSFEDVQIVCQRTQIAHKTQVHSFTDEYDFAKPYTAPVQSDALPVDMAMQFSEPMAVAS